MTALGLVALVVLALAGVPIFLAILVAVIIILVLGMGIDPLVSVSVAFNRMGGVTLLAVPLFLLLGNILAYGGAARPMIRVLNAFMGHLPGGPAYAVIIANVMVAAMCSSPLAGIAAFAPVMIPLLTGLGYSASFATGLVIVSAMLEPLIPPSTTSIIYSVFSAGIGEPVSVLTLWTASILPGLVIAALLGLTVYIYTLRGHYTRLPSADWRERWEALKEGWAIILMPVVVLGPLYIGWATPTETAALGLIYVIFISAFIYRGLNPKVLVECFASAVRVMGTIFVIMMAAMLLTVAVTYARVPYDMAEWVADMGLSWWTLIGAVLILYLIMGMFLDPSAIIMISVPLLLPGALQAGINPIQFGVFACLATNIANITPPYGLTLFASQSILGQSYVFVFRSVLIFLPAVVIGFLLVSYVPSLTTWLPAVTGR